MNIKKCTVEPVEEPPPDICKEVRIKRKLAAGIKLCPPKPKPRPEVKEFDPCCDDEEVAICIERLRFYPTCPPSKEPIRCIPAREVTGTALCDRIREERERSLSPQYHKCVKTPPLPPPPAEDKCEVIRRRRRIQECKERLKKYYG